MSEVISALEPGEFVIEPSPELIFRQITKHLIRNDRVGSIAFLSSADRGKPSYSRSSIVSPQASRDWHTSIAGSPSLAVCALAVDDVSSLGIRSIDDSNAALSEGESRAPGHCFIDCRNLTKSEMTNLRSNLLRFAIGHGFMSTRDPKNSAEIEFDFS